MATSQQEWEPTEQDMDLFRNSVSGHMKDFATTEDTFLPIERYEETWPLWMWKRAIEQRDQFVAEFHGHFIAWWRLFSPNFSVLSVDDPVFKVFLDHLFLRWHWLYLKLVVATAGLPQPLHRCTRLCDLSSAEHQAIQMAVHRTLHSRAPGRLNPANRLNPLPPIKPFR